MNTKRNLSRTLLLGAALGVSLGLDELSESLGEGRQAYEKDGGIEAASIFGRMFTEPSAKKPKRVNMADTDKNWGGPTGRPPELPDLGRSRPSQPERPTRQDPPREREERREPPRLEKPSQEPAEKPQRREPPSPTRRPA